MGSISSSNKLSTVIVFVLVDPEFRVRAYYRGNEEELIDQVLHDIDLLQQEYCTHHVRISRARQIITTDSNLWPPSSGIPRVRSLSRPVYRSSYPTLLQTAVRRVTIVH